jgi:N-acetyl-1-D-myo-inositol-2-amino-2-deoxy-alpha-D-glucopyranoside deacetylase
LPCKDGKFWKGTTMKTLLVIFAHPDDEAHGPAGTIAKYAAEGVDVHYLCATRGEAGMVDERWLTNDKTVAELRTVEVQRAVGALGINSLRFLNFRDSGMAGSSDNHHPESLHAAPLDEVAQRIADHIRRIRPDAIITHDQYGWYGHPDHIKCYAATRRAYELLYGMKWDEAGNATTTTSIPRLYVSSFSKWWLKVTTWLMPFFGKDPRRHGQNQDVNLLDIASWDVPLTTKIQVGDYLAVKEKAIACHASQQPLTRSHNPLVSAILRQSQKTEAFSRLYPPLAYGEAIETSLFAAEPHSTWATAKNVPSLA